MGFLVREATPGEEDQVIGMYEWLFEPPGHRPPGWRAERAVSRLREAIDSEDSAVLVCERDDRFVGLCTVYLDLNSVRYGRRCWVEDLAVDPDLRSQGIGATLLDAAGDWARERGATHLGLYTADARKDAQRFYARRDPIATGVNYVWAL
jgi:GNAT superfamily N-acetyltransferase